MASYSSPQAIPTVLVQWKSICSSQQETGSIPSQVAEMFGLMVQCRDLGGDEVSLPITVHTLRQAIQPGGPLYPACMQFTTQDYKEVTLDHQHVANKWKWIPAFRWSRSAWPPSHFLWLQWLMSRSHFWLSLTCVGPRSSCLNARSIAIAGDHKLGIKRRKLLHTFLPVPLQLD